ALADGVTRAPRARRGEVGGELAGVPGERVVLVVRLWFGHAILPSRARRTDDDERLAPGWTPGPFLDPSPAGPVGSPAGRTGARIPAEAGGHLGIPARGRPSQVAGPGRTGPLEMSGVMVPHRGTDSSTIAVSRAVAGRAGEPPRDELAGVDAERGAPRLGERAQRLENGRAACRGSG